MSNIKAVLFDFDGTLMDTNGIIIQSWQDTFKVAESRFPSLEEICANFGEPLRGSMEKLFPDRDPDEMVDLYRHYQRHIFRGKLSMFPGMRELVFGLKERGIKVAIVTSRFWNTINRGVYVFDIADEFDAVVSGEDATKPKPDPEPCLVCLERLGVKPEEALFIGDTKFDILCGRNAGIKTVLVNWTLAMTEEQKKGIYKPDYFIDRAEDIYDIIDSL
jgi:pyrophosphatase PpaX